MSDETKNTVLVVQDSTIGHKSPKAGDEKEVKKDGN